MLKFAQIVPCLVLFAACGGVEEEVTSDELTSLLSPACSDAFEILQDNGCGVNCIKIHTLQFVLFDGSSRWTGSTGMVSSSSFSARGSGDMSRVNPMTFPVTFVHESFTATFARPQVLLTGRPIYFGTRFSLEGDVSFEAIVNDCSVSGGVIQVKAIDADGRSVTGTIKTEDRHFS